MWQLWAVAFFHLAAFQRVEPHSKRSLQEIQDGLTQNKTVLQNETDAPGSTMWLVSTTRPLLTVQSSTDHKPRRLRVPTITVRAENGTCRALLSCAVPEEEDGLLNFTWVQVNGGVILSTAQTLNITQKPQQGTPDYVCIVRSQAGESSSTVSLKEHCQDSPIASKHLSASFYAKYIVPLFIVLVILLVLFLMYRRKRGREIHSSMESINESSASDKEVGPSVERTAEVSFLPEGVKSLPRDNASSAGAAASHQDEASDAPKELPTQA